MKMEVLKFIHTIKYYTTHIVRMVIVDDFVHTTFNTINDKKDEDLLSNYLVALCICIIIECLEIRS